MKKKIAFLLALVLACTMLSITCFAAEPVDGEIYVRIDGIDGLCEESHHKNWIEGVNYRLNYAKDGTVCGITFTHLIEPATTEIIERYMNRVWTKTATLNICQHFRGKQYTVLTVEMNTLLVSDTKVILLDDGHVAETVTLTANQVTVTETPIDFPY